MSANSGRSHHLPVEHAGQAHTLYVLIDARHLGRQVETRNGGSENGILARILGCGIGLDCKVEPLASNQLAEGNLLRRIRQHGNRAILDGELAYGDTELAGGHLEQSLASGG